MAEPASGYLLLFQESTPHVYDAMSRDERRAALDRWNEWCDELVARGKLRSGNTLAPEARVVVADPDGAVTDGPFTEARELVGGYFLLDAASLEEATAIARECPNLPHGMVVEVRAVAAACHLARSLGLDTMREPAGQARPAG